MDRPKLKRLPNTMHLSVLPRMQRTRWETENLQSAILFGMQGVSPCTKAGGGPRAELSQLICLVSNFRLTTADAEDATACMDLGKWSLDSCKMASCFTASTRSFAWARFASAIFSLCSSRYLTFTRSGMHAGLSLGLGKNRDFPQTGSFSLTGGFCILTALWVRALCTHARPQRLVPLQQSSSISTQAHHCVV